MAATDREVVVEVVQQQTELVMPVQALHERAHFDATMVVEAGDVSRGRYAS